MTEEQLKRGAVQGAALITAPRLAVPRHLNRQLAYAGETIERVAAHDEPVQRLRSVPSIGLVTAACVATIDDAQRFPHGHQPPAYRSLPE